MSWILEYFVVYLSCVYIYICSTVYVELPIVLLYLLQCLMYHMLSKTRRNSRRLHIYIVHLLYLVRCLVYHMLFRTRRNSSSLHRVIREVLVLGQLVVVYKIPHSSCIHAAVYQVHRSCLCHTYSWFLLISWIMDLSILLSICRAYIYLYICSAGYASKPVLLYLLQCLVYHMLSKTRRSSGSLHRVIGDVLVLVLLVVYKIPFSSCMFDTAVVLEPGKM